MANKNSRTKNSALSLVTGIGGQLLNEALRFITRTVFIYTLGKMFLGINGLFAEIMTMLSLTNLGVGTAIIYRLYKPIAGNDEHQVRVLLKFYKKAYQAIGAVILVLGLCLLPFLDVLIKDYDRLGSIGLNAEVIYLLFLGQSVVSYFFFAYRNCVFAADQKQYLVNSVNMVTNIVTAVVQIAVLYFWQDFIIYLLVGIVDGILKNVVIAVMTYRQYPNYFTREKDSLSKVEIQSMFKDCGALLIYKVSGIVNKSTGNFIISAFIGLATVALYSNYLVIYVAIRNLANQMYSAIKGSMGNLFATSDMERKVFIFEVCNLLCVIVFGTLAVIIAVDINVLMEAWLGPDYIIPQPYPMLLGTEILLVGIFNNLQMARNVTGLFKQMWMRPLFSIIVNLSVTLIFVQRIGIYAIPLGFIAALAGVNLVTDPIIIYKHGFNNYKPVYTFYIQNILYISVIVICAFICYYLCSLISIENLWMTAIINAFICCTLPPSIILLVFGWKKECKYLVNIIKKHPNNNCKL